MLLDHLVEIIQADNFPDVETALDKPDGLLAYGFVLSTEIVLSAYRQAIFPWYEHNQPVLWWSPQQRAILEPENLKLSRSLKKSLRNRGYRVSFDQQFYRVISFCAQVKRDHQHSTWITEEMIQCYTRLHEMNRAHSLEVWHNDVLVGGLYGLIINETFCGESMFSLATDASKVALAALCFNAHRLGVQLIDCQMMTPHLQSLGAIARPRSWYTNFLQQHDTPPLSDFPSELPLNVPKPGIHT